VPNGTSTSDEKKADATTPSSKTKDGLGITVTDVLRILGGLLLLNSAISYFVTSNSLTWGWRPWWSKTRQLQAYVVQHPTFALSLPRSLP